jgi:hypothetical protein
MPIRDYQPELGQEGTVTQPKVDALCVRFDLSLRDTGAREDGTRNLSFNSP